MQTYELYSRVNGGTLGIDPDPNRKNQLFVVLRFPNKAIPPTEEEVEELKKVLAKYYTRVEEQLGLIPNPRNRR